MMLCFSGFHSPFGHDGFDDFFSESTTTTEKRGGSKPVMSVYVCIFLLWLVGIEPKDNVSVIAGFCNML